MSLNSDEDRLFGKRVLIEGHNLTLASGTGIATYARGLSAAVRDAGCRTDVLVGSNRALPAHDPELAEVILFDGPRNTNLIHKAGIELRRAFGAPLGLRAGSIAGLSGTVVGRSERLAGFDRIHAIAHLIDVERLHFMRHGRRLRVEVEGQPDLFHATRPAPIEVRGAANIYTLHDIVPLRLPDTTADDKVYYARMIRELVRSADHILTVSEFSRQDIIAFTGMDPSRITNTYQAVAFPDHMVARPPDVVADALARRHGLAYKDYYLFVGAIEPKKNVGRLVDAYAAADVSRPLVVAGGLGWMYEGDLERINSERFLSYKLEGQTMTPVRRVRRLSYLPLQDVVDLIRGARALLYPSIYEGFGLPAAEAMLLGTPVMTSNVSSLPEITGDAALLVDPYDVDDMARAIRTLDTDDDLLADMTTRGRAQAGRFSRSEFAASIASVYRSVLG